MNGKKLCVFMHLWKGISSLNYPKSVRMTDIKRVRSQLMEVVGLEKGEGCRLQLPCDWGKKHGYYPPLHGNNQKTQNKDQVDVNPPAKPKETWASNVGKWALSCIKALGFQPWSVARTILFVVFFLVIPMAVYPYHPPLSCKDPTVCEN
jgi:hypothetical protein